MNTYTTIQLSAKDALEFVKFQKHYAFVELMESLGIFSLQNGSVTIHFNSGGQIGRIDVNKIHKPTHTSAESQDVFANVGMVSS